MRGTGKTSMARILAKGLNCKSFDKPTTTPCGKCAPAWQSRRGDDMDVTEIDAASNTQVEKTREVVIETCAVPPGLQPIPNLHHRRSAHALKKLV